ncbi:hypothetical protein [Actinoplanes sp. M2I2]|uniref:hypothetical protein n=1 Tax=Actinoplanes sp. M2I2 TaxID=1734444 RepID=UPI00201FC9C1|nr:hypothetical protein [Actinoplanes sp. M2I2]
MSEPATAWMRLCAYRVAGPDRGHKQAELADGLWRQSTEEDRVQHIRVRPAPSPYDETAECRLDIGILLMADSDEKASAVGARICTGALAADPDTADWTFRPLLLRGTP